MRVSQNHLRLFVVVVVLVAGLRLVPMFTDWGEAAPKVTDEGPDEKTAQSRTYYRIGNEEPIRFKLEPYDDVIKIDSILEWPRDMVTFAMSNRVSYALEMQILDYQKRLLWQDSLWLQTRKTRKFDEVNQRALEPAFYVGGTRTLLDKRLLTVPVKRLAEGGRWLTVRLAQPGGSHAAIGAFRLDRTPVKNPIRTWNRLPLERREERSRGNIFDPSLLSDEECRRLVRQSWRIIVPEGKPRTDFRPITVYRSPLKLFDEKIERKDVVTHLLLREGREMIFNIKGPARARLTTRPPVGADPDIVARLEAEWRDLKGTPKAQTYEVHFEKGDREAAQWTIARGPNTLVLRSLEHTCLVKLEIGLPSAGQEPNAEPTWRPVLPRMTSGHWYLCGKTRALHDLGFDGGKSAPTPQPVHDLGPFEFDLPPLKEGDRTDYRISIRGLHAGEEEETAAAVTVEMIDSAGSAIGTHRLKAESPHDPTSWFSDANGSCEPGASSEFYLSAPSSVRVLRVSSDQPCLVDAACRTGSIPLDVSVPDDYREGLATRLRKSIDTSKSWFAIRPTNLKEAFLAGRVLRVQSGRADVVPRQHTEALEGDEGSPPIVTHAGHAMMLWPTTIQKPLHAPLDWTPETYFAIPDKQPMRVRLPLLYRMDLGEPYPLRVLLRTGMERLQEKAEEASAPIKLLFPKHGKDATSLDLIGRLTSLIRTKGEVAFANVLPEDHKKRTIWRLHTSYRATATRPAVFLVRKPGAHPMHLTLSVSSTGWDDVLKPLTVTHPEKKDPKDPKKKSKDAPGAEVIDLGGVDEADSSDMPVTRRRYRVEMEVIPMKRREDKPRSEPVRGFSFRKLRYRIHETGTSVGQPFLVGPHAERIGEASQVFARLLDDLPAGTYLVRVRPLGNYVLWTRLTHRTAQQTIIPPGRSITWHLRGPEMVRLRWRAITDGEARVIVPINVSAITPSGTPELQNTLDPSSREGEGWLGKRYYLPPGLVALVVSNPARRGKEPGLPVAVRLLRHTGSQPMAGRVRLEDVDEQARLVKIEDEIHSAARWRLMPHGPALRFPTALDFPVADKKVAQHFRFLFRAILDEQNDRTVRPVVHARQLGEDGKHLVDSYMPLVIKTDPKAWLDGQRKGLSTIDTLDLSIMPGTRYVELTVDPDGDTVPLLIWAGRRWREEPPLHIVRGAGLRRARVAFRAPNRFFREWQSVMPRARYGSSLPDAKAFRVVNRSYPFLNQLKAESWKGLAGSEGRALQVLSTDDSIAFLEPTFTKVGDPVPWTPATYAELTQGVAQAISVLPQPRSPADTPVELALRYDLPAGFDQQKPIKVWLNNKLVASVLPRERTGVVRIRDVKPDKHLIKVVTGQKGAHTFLNALPTESKDALRLNARVGVVLPDNGQIKVKVVRRAMDLQTIHIPIYLSDAQPEEFEGRETALVRLELAEPPPSEAKGVLRRGTTRNRRRFILPLNDREAARFEAGGQRFRSAGMVFFPIADDLPTGTYVLNMTFPPNLKALIRPFIRVERELLSEPAIRMIYEALPEER